MVRWRVVGLLLALAVANALVIVLLPYFATEDGPTHIADGVTLLLYGNPEHAVFSHYYTLSYFPVPNLSTVLLFEALVHLVSPDTAEKVVLCGYVVGLPLALFYAVCSVRRESAWLALLAFPCTFTLALQIGLYNFACSIVTFLVAVGYALRHRGRMGVRQGVILGLLLFLTYATHIVSFVEAVLFLGTIAVWDWIAAVRAASPVSFQAAGRAFAERCVPLLFPAVPSLVLAAAFAWSTDSTHGTTTFGWDTPKWKLLVGLLTFTWGLLTLDPRETIFCLLLALLVLTLIVAAVRGRLPHWEPQAGDALALAAVVSAVAYLVAPEQIASGGDFVTERLALFPFYAVVLWLAYQPLGERLREGAAWIAVAAGVGFLVLRLPVYTYFSGHVSEYMSVAPCIQRDSTLLQLNLSRDLSPHNVQRPGVIFPLGYESSRLAAVRDSIDLGNVDGSLPYFPYHFRAALNPFVHLQVTDPGMDTVPPQVDLLRYNRSTPGRVDYVLVFGRLHATPQVLHDPATQRLDRQLAAAYRLIAVSRPSGLVQVYALRSLAGSAVTVGSVCTGRGR